MTTLPQPPDERGHYRALAARACDYLREKQGRAREDDLAAALFGPTAKGPIWGKMVASVLHGDPRFERAADGTWALAGLGLPARDLDGVDFVVLDIESTGLKPWRQRVLEVAALRISGGRVVDAFASLLNPGRRVPRYIRDLAGFAEEDLAAAPAFAAVADELLRFLGDAVLVGHGLGLDIAYLQRELHLLGRPPLANALVDTIELAGRLLPGRGKPTLDNLAILLGLPVTRRHRAAADARLVAHLFNHLLELAQAGGAKTLADLGVVTVAGGGRARYALLDSSPLRDVPEGPGVYILRDSARRVVYVGKGINLRERLATYFSRPPDYVRRMEGLLEAVADFEAVPLGSELEALLVEARLIAEHRPPFNTQQQANRQPAFIRIDLQEEYPRLVACAEPAADGARYYGPLPNGRAVREALRRLNDLFPLRTCRRALGKQGRKACPACRKLSRGRCLGPCVGFMMGEQYRALAEETVHFLDGDRRPTLSRLQADLAAALAAHDRPRAAALQKVLRSAQRFELPAAAGWSPDRVANVAVVQPSPAEGAVEVFVVHGGRYAGQHRLCLADASAASLAVILRGMASRLAPAQRRDEANIVARWLAAQAEPPAVPLPTGEEGCPLGAPGSTDGRWERAAASVIALAEAMAAKRVGLA